MVIMKENTIEIQELKKLVERFNADFKNYKKDQTYNEAMTRQQYIDVLLKLLGWDITNPMGLSFNDREIVAEEYSSENKKDRPDYTIRMNGISRFYIEAKKVSVDIFNEADPAIQTRRYGWNSNHKISVLTNFEYLVIYLTYAMPTKNDTSKTYRYKYYHYTEYVEKFDEIYDLLSRESVVKGKFDQWTSDISPLDSTKTSLDTIFLSQLNRWRKDIGQELYYLDGGFSSIALMNEQIQDFLNQIIFLRFAEDNHYESTEMLKNEILKQPDYIKYFKKLDRKYNSGLFTDANIISKISSNLLTDIVENLYFPNVSYDFSVIDLSILSKVYEYFLQEELVIEDGEVRLKKTKSASVKAVVSTPDNIVVSMVKRVLSKKLDGKNPDEILKLRIADLAVGSGIFLIEAYNYIEAYLTQWYADEKNMIPNPLLVPFDVKKRIIQEVLVGFDINSQAVQLTRFSLMLRILSFEGKERVEKVTPILPKLENNIRCGNSLVSMSDFDLLNLSSEELFEINPMLDGLLSEKYDVVIGNPPYLSKEDIKQSTNSKEIAVYDEIYKSTIKQYDKYLLFMERSLKVVKDDGDIILLVPNKFINIEAGKGIRDVLKSKMFLKKIFDFKYTQIFPTATNYVSVVHLSKSEHFEYVEISGSDEVYKDKKGVQYSLDDLTGSHWFLTDDIRLKTQYEFAKNNFPSIETVITPKNGVQTSRNSVYIIPKAKTKSCKDSIFYDKNGKQYKLEKQLLKDFYKPNGNKVGRSYSTLISDSYIIFPYSEGKIISESKLKSEYSGVYEYFFDHKTELLPKAMGGSRDVRGSSTEIIWYQFGRSQFLKEITEPKIIVGVMSNQPNFNIDTKSFIYASGGTAGYIGLFLKENSQYSLEYIQAWLSHQFTDLIFQTIGSSFEGEFYSHGTALYKDIPLLPINFNSEIEIEKYNYINALVRDISNLNEEIDQQNSRRLKEILKSKKEILIDQINSTFDELLEIKMR
ncbi:Eco57I restriction-modification methylase domain-containing protein [Streptococcus sp. HMSC062B01]|uniref:Eco57I restriction-modification methylase domain-containing protein n=1 Tax=Streptococcus sp. HMSC062B01 TaxID=1739284 RepID=UPI001F230E6F|nr:Eco57I restriction-modification methylase domain-containing protein [Streptococcus sp. HMSC062B01]